MKPFTYPIVAGDIGGTNARFAVMEAPGAEAIDLPTEPTGRYATLEEALAHALEKGAAPAPATGLFAAAGPIREGGLDLTNASWHIRPPRVAAHCGLDEVVLFNDFEAQALALAVLRSDHVETIGEATFRTDATKAVIGPGTGLGVGVLAFADDRWFPVPGEGGHVDIGPRTAREADIFAHLERIEGRVSGEQVLSGDGLLNLAGAVAATDGAARRYGHPSDVTFAALDGGDATAREALTLFATLLGRMAGDLALTVLARGGVYIGGGIAPRMVDFLRASPFREAFLDKAPHGDLMAAIATGIVVDDRPALDGLLGLAGDPDRFVIDLTGRRWRP